MFSLEDVCILSVIVGLVVVIWRFFSWLGQNSQLASKEEELRQLSVTAKQVTRLAETDLLDEGSAAAVLEAVELRRQVLLGREPGGVRPARTSPAYAGGSLHAGGSP